MNTGFEENQEKLPLTQRGLSSYTCVDAPPFSFALNSWNDMLLNQVH